MDDDPFRAERDSEVLQNLAVISPFLCVLPIAI
jgi:hypothetical protein